MRAKDTKQDDLPNHEPRLTSRLSPASDVICKQRLSWNSRRPKVNEVSVRRLVDGVCLLENICDTSGDLNVCQKWVLIVK